jgi:hypothetical protein
LYKRVRETNSNRPLDQSVTTPRNVAKRRRRHAQDVMPIVANSLPLPSSQHRHHLHRITNNNTQRPRRRALVVVADAAPTPRTPRGTPTPTQRQPPPLPRPRTPRALRAMAATTTPPPPIAAARAAAEQWLAIDPEPESRAEVEALLQRLSSGGDENDAAASLLGLFPPGGRLEFGTAGLRAKMGPGPARMNRVTVQQATQGLAAYLLSAEGSSALGGPDAVRAAGVPVRRSVRGSVKRSLARENSGASPLPAFPLCTKRAMA